MPSHAHHLTSFFHILRERLPPRFVRTPRKITPAHLIGVLCLMSGFGRKGYRRVVHELRDGLHRAFGWDAAVQVPSPQALGQARRSLSRAVCDDAFRAIRDACRSAITSSRSPYRGYRLIAVDATRLSLPPSAALIAAFGQPENQRGKAVAPMAGLVQMWEVGANLPFAFAITTCDFDERGEAVSLFSQLKPRDLLIGDRGYPSHAVFAALHHQRCRFLLRCSQRACREVIEFLRSGAEDAVVTLQRRDHKLRVDPRAPEIPVRLVRVILPDGTPEVLATNLWGHRGHAREQLAKLYTERWSVETAFREMKVFHALEDFSATYPEGIYQEIAAIQIFLALTARLEAVARDHAAHLALKDAQPPFDPSEIRFNRLMISDTVIMLLRAAARSPEHAIEIFPVLIDSIWKSRSRKRPGRAFPRVRKTPLRGYRP